jgi:hypothetical protein
MTPETIQAMRDLRAELQGVDNAIKILNPQLSLGIGMALTLIDRRIHGTAS